MKPTLPLIWLVFSAFLISSACTLTVDLEPLENRECPEGQKLCRERCAGQLCKELCVSLTDPRYGCRPNTCDPCNLKDANPICRGSECQIAGCHRNTRDCDGRHETGCERDLDYEAAACGSCTNRCLTPNGTPACRAGRCATGDCNAGYVDCNGEPADGCESLTQDCVE